MLRLSDESGRNRYRTKNPLARSLGDANQVKPESSKKYGLRAIKYCELIEMQIMTRFTDLSTLNSLLGSHIPT